MKIAIIHNLILSGKNAIFEEPSIIQGVQSAIASKGHIVTTISAEEGVEAVLLQIRKFNPDLIFNLTEGDAGANRVVLYPSLFENLKIPYTGSDPHTLMMTIDKHLTKIIARDNGVPAPQGIAVNVANVSYIQWDRIRMPVIIKPVFEDYCRGIELTSICRLPAEAKDKVYAMLTAFESLLIEEYIEGIDVDVPFLEGVGDGVLPACEVEFPDASPIKHLQLISDTGGRVTIRCPARISESVSGLLKIYVKRLVRAFNIRDYAIFDFRVTPDGVPYLLEINGLPLMHQGSPLFISAEQRHLKPADVIWRICDSAIRRKRAMTAGHMGTNGKDKKSLRVGLVFNVKRTKPTKESDSEAEWDSPETIYAIKKALESLGYSVILLEATETLPQRLADARVDLVFNLAEGYRGRTREAQVPALCDMLGIAHTGSDATTLAISLDKALTKDLFLRNGVATPAYQTVRSTREKLDSRLRFPLIIKPNAEGSSKGISTNSVVMNEEELRKVVKENLQKYGPPVLIEEYIKGREFTVGLIQTEQGLRVLPPLEVVFLDKSNELPVYSFEIKQDMDKSVRYDCPAQIDKKTERLLASVARKAFKALGCRDYARVDIRISESGVPYVFEVNPLPGLTPNFSDMCLIANAIGMKYEELIASILRPCLRRMRMRNIKQRFLTPPNRPLKVTEQQEQTELLFGNQGQ